MIERDEGAMAIIALQWIKGFPPYIYSLNNAGPLAYLIYASSTYMFGSNIIPIRMINNILFFLSVFALFLVVVQLFGKKVALYSSFFYGVFMSAPIDEGQLSLTSSLSASFIVFSIYFCWKYFNNNSEKELFKASFLFSCAFLIKVHLALGIVWLPVVILVNSLSNSNEFGPKRTLIDFVTTIVGFSILPLIFLTYFWSISAIDDLFYVFVELTLLGHPNLPDV
ncbi:MAG: ArnT family glycosyltransferase, partial [Asgard group archaeon]